MKPWTLAVTLSLTLACAGAPGIEREDAGTISFPTSGTPEAQTYFIRGVALLHNYGWKRAIEQFHLAQSAQPDFAMAYWGETLCYNHPLFSQHDVTKPREVLSRLGPTPEARLARAPTDREKGFLGAVEVLWGEGNARERVVGYMESMRTLYEQYPDDAEAATFYALSLMMVSQLTGDLSLRLEMQAGAVALRVFAEQPNHPGAAHYIIHAFDDPLHAPLALRAAERYSEIAPAPAHALHMPTHIFIQLGMWERVAKQNDVSYAAARDSWEPGDSGGDMLHAIDWGQYGYLQLGDYARARQAIETAAEIVTKPYVNRSRYSLMKSRYIIETEEWNVAPLAEAAPADEIFAVGLSAARTGDLAAAERAASRLGEMAEKQEATLADMGSAEHSMTADDVDQARSVMVMYRELAALVNLARGGTSEAMTLMTQATQIEDAMSPPRGPVDPIKPSYELFGEMLLDLGRPAEAVEQFEKTLLGRPNRSRALLGLARAYAQAGDQTRARTTYQKLANIWSGRTSLPGYQEAQAFLSSTN